MSVASCGFLLLPVLSRARFVLTVWCRCVWSPPSFGLPQPRIYIMLNRFRSMLNLVRSMLSHCKSSKINVRGFPLLPVAPRARFVVTVHCRCVWTPPQFGLPQPRSEIMLVFHQC